MMESMNMMKILWADVKTGWGKACIVLFYSFLILQILGTLWSLYDTTTGWECLWNTLDAGDVSMVAGTMKVVNFWILGFMLYAYKGGIGVWNIAMAFAFYTGQYIMYKPVFTEFLAENCPTELYAFNASMIVTIVWILLALILSGIEMKLGGGGTSGTGDESYLLAGN